MSAAKNVLFIMYDQLRFDYLSCAGHPYLKTPNFDRLAAKGVRFTNTYVQSPICGPSRMSCYTGRYVHSHGAAGNGYPLRIGERTLGDYLRDIGAECWLIGKTHMVADVEGMRRLGVPADSVIGARVSECGYDIWVREDGLVCIGPENPDEPIDSPYNDALIAKGYPAPNPWHVHANSGIDEDGNIASGWYLRNSRAAANIRQEDSETPWLTDQAIEFLDSRGDAPWLCHLSFIKPHWPYIAPEPYASMFGPDKVVPPVRSDAERQGTNPVFEAFMEMPEGRSFSRDEVRDTVVPAYMGLVAQCDAELGRLLDHLEATGRMQDTMIVLTSDHGDYLGDHWMGDKCLFHEPSVKVPLIVYDPSKAAEKTRGTLCDALVEAIDLTPTFIEVLGGKAPRHIVEGRSLLPWLHGETPENWRNAVFSELDYGGLLPAERLDLLPSDAHLFMIFDGRFKMMHADGGFAPMLFDLETDPRELTDLGADPAHEETRKRLYEMLNRWARRYAQRTTISDEALFAQRGTEADFGCLIGFWDENEVAPAVRPFFVGKPERDYR